MPRGVVRWFAPDRGYGFLALDDGGEDLFVHASEILSSGAPKLLREGQAVEFEFGEGERGPQALRVRVIGAVGADTVLGVLGTIAWYEPSKGYGFVTPDGGGPQIFVHSSAIVTGGVVGEGQRVAFLVVEGERGPQAEHLVPLGPDAGQSVGSAQGATAGDGADGTVTWYDEGKGFGFITPDTGSEDVFVHARSLPQGVTSLAVGDRVAFGVTRGDRGLQAREVRPIRPGAASGAHPSDRSAARATGGRRGRDERPVGAGEGVVKRFDGDRGFGFIAPDAGGADLFVHVSVVAGGEPLQAGDRVRFAVRQSDRGQQADRVERL